MSRKLMMVFFRTDGDSEIGLGHLVRSLALSEMLKEEFDTTFIIKEKSVSYLEEISRKTFEKVIVIPNEIEIKEEPQFLSQFIRESSILVLDGYKFSSTYQKELVHINKVKLVCIDDLHEINFYADIIINHSIGISSKEYKSIYYTNFLLGGSYALLRAPFREKNVTLRNFKENLSAFICFGGADPYNFTEKALQRILGEKKFDTINVVVGNAYKYIEGLKIEMDALQDKRLRLFVNISAGEMRDLMLVSQVAICSASSVALEYMSVGGALFIVQTVDNQKDVFKNLLQFNLARNWADFSLQQDFSTILENQARIFDGNIRSRYIKAFQMLAEEASLTFRRAMLSDMHQYYFWVNDEITRNNSFTTSVVNLDDHKKWFSAKVQDKNSVLYIFFLKDIAVGQVRFDVNNDEALISFSIDASFRGKGIGRMILKTAIEALYQEEEVKKIIGYVKLSNIQSMKIFESLKFNKQETSKYPNANMYALNRGIYECN